MTADKRTTRTRKKLARLLRLLKRHPPLMFVLGFTEEQRAVVLKRLARSLINDRSRERDDHLNWLTEELKLNLIEKLSERASWVRNDMISALLRALPGWAFRFVPDFIIAYLVTKLLKLAFSG